MSTAPGDGLAAGALGNELGAVGIGLGGADGVPVLPTPACPLVWAEGDPGASRKTPRPARARTIRANAALRWPGVSSITAAATYGAGWGAARTGPAGRRPAAHRSPPAVRPRAGRPRAARPASGARCPSGPFAGATPAGRSLRRAPAAPPPATGSLARRAGARVPGTRRSRLRRHCRTVLTAVCLSPLAPMGRRV